MKLLQKAAGWFKGWMAQTPEGFTTAFSRKKALRERVTEALEGRPKRRGLLAFVLVAAGAAVLGGGAMLYSVAPVQQATQTLWVTGVFAEGGARSGTEMLTAAQNRLKALYPGVQLKLTLLQVDESDPQSSPELSRLRTQIMAGQGPDVLVGYQDLLLTDPYKQVAAGVFCDLAPYIRQTGYDLTRLNQLALQSGQYEGGQYLIPLNYKIHSLDGGVERFAKYGVDPGACDTLEGYLNQLEKFQKAYPQMQLCNDLAEQFWLLFPEFADPRNQELALDDPLVRRWLACCKAADQAPQGGAGGWQGQLTARGSLFVGQTLLLQELKENGDTVTSVVPPNAVEGVTGEVCCWIGVLASSKNQLNGWRLVEQLLNEDILLLGNANQDHVVPVLANCGELLQTYYQQKGRIDRLYGPAYLEHNLPYADRVNRVVFTTGPYRQVLALFEPYFKGEAEYETCAEQAQRYWRVYRTE